jgi:hypothetical protein
MFMNFPLKDKLYYKLRGENTKEKLRTSNKE